MASKLQRFDFVPALTPEEQQAGRRACADNATDPGEYATFLSMLGLEGDE